VKKISHLSIIFSIVRPYSTLLILNIAAIVTTFLVVMNLPGGEYGMLPLLILPCSGIISLLLFISLSIIFRKTIRANWKNVFLATTILLINGFEISVFFMWG
jgi:hypothetical protein